MLKVRMIGLSGIAALFALISLFAQNRTNEQRSPLKTVAEVPMPGPAVRFDYQSLDTLSGRLYIAHMNADQLVVFDTLARKVIANLDGFSRVHGVWAVPEINRLFASVTGQHKVAAVDMKTLQMVATVGPINYPDGIAYAPRQQRVFVSDEHGGTDVVIDAQKNTLLKKIDLGGGAGNTVYDPGSGRVLVAVHEKDELVSIDPEKLEIVTRMPLPGLKEPHGVSLDVANRVAFVAGEGNHALALIDLTNMKILGIYPVGEDPDVLSFDPGFRLLYVSAESGDVWVYREVNRSLKAAGNVHMPNAHTVCADPKTHLVYFPLQDVDGHPILRIMEPVEKQ